MSACLSSAPVANLDASDSMEKGFDLSGMRRTGAVINLCFRVSNALCSDGVQFQG